MDISTLFFAAGFPIFLALFGLGAALAVSDANDIEFWVARICFIAAALDLAGFTVAWLYLAEKLTPRFAIFGAIIGALILVSLVGGLRWVNYRQDKTSTVLRAASEPRPPLPPQCVADVPKDAFVIFAGTSAIWTDRFPIVLLRMNGIPMLSIDSVDGELEIKTLKIFDVSPSLIASVDDGEIWVAPQVRHQKPNRSTLIVYDKTDTQVLKVRLLNLNTLYVEGIFRDVRGTAVSILPDRLIFPGNNIFTSACFGRGGIVVN
jgi:hypothetical protein